MHVASVPQDLRGLRAVYDDAQALLSRVGVGAPPWALRCVQRLDHRTVLLELGRGTDDPLILGWRRRIATDGPALARGRAQVVLAPRLPASLSLEGADAEVLSLARRSARVLATADARAALLGPPEEELPPWPDAPVLALTPEGLLPWLGPLLAGFAPWAARWTLQGARPWCLPGRPPGVELLALDRWTDAVAQVQLTRLGDHTEGWRTWQFALSHDAHAAPLDARALVLAVGVALEAAEHTVRFEAPATEPPRPEEARPEAHRDPNVDRVVRLPVFHPPADPDPAPELQGPLETVNLSISGPCLQRCVFCNLHDEVPQAERIAPEVLAVYARDIARGAKLGARTLRINGIEPLVSPDVFPLMALARAEGYTHFEVFSSCRPLSDAAFCRRFLDAMPRTYMVTIPVYGHTAALHDAVTGAPGSFAQIVRAADNLRRMVQGGGRWGFQTVLTREVLPHLTALHHFLARWGRTWTVHLPFPSGRDGAETYARVAVRMTDALRAVFPNRTAPLAHFEEAEVPLCLALRHQREARSPVVSPSDLSAPPRRPPGRRNLDPRIGAATGGGDRAPEVSAVVPCPHEARCELASRCPAAFYRAYIDRYGWDECAPMSLSEAQAIAALPLLDLRRPERLRAAE
jgi:hypothetical protein